MRFLLQGCSKEHFCILMLKRNGSVFDALPTRGLAKESQTLKSHLQTGELFLTLEIRCPDYLVYRWEFFVCRTAVELPSSGRVFMNVLQNNRQESILVVDDDPEVSRVVSDMLHLEGYSATVTDSPARALSFLDSIEFALAFVDIKMPLMSGFELASRIRTRRPQTEIVFMTGHATFENAVQAIKVGAYDYLRKPFSLDELRLCLRRFEERQALKKRLESAERRYYHLVQNIPSLIFVVRKDFSLEFINRTCLPMLGYSPEDAMKEPGWLLQRIHPADRKRVSDLFSRALLSGSTQFSLECRLVHKDGHLIHTLIKSIPREIEKNDRRPERVQGIILDITDRIFLEKAEVQRQKLKILREVASDVAHEIRNPLVSIGGFARRLMRRYPELSEGEIILRESERLENIVRRMTEYLRPIEVTYEKCSINRVLEQCVKQVAGHMRNTGIRSELTLDRSIPTVYMDLEILAKIFLDLLQNILKEMEKGETLHIRTYGGEENTYAEFRTRFSHEHVRIEKELLSPFDPDVQRENLPLSYRLLREMGGLLSFAQEDRDRVFTVALPKKFLQEEKTPELLSSDETNGQFGKFFS
jgi:two-component system sensor histidine kinase HydH